MLRLIDTRWMAILYVKIESCRVVDFLKLFSYKMDPTPVIKIALVYDAGY